MVENVAQDGGRDKRGGAVGGEVGADVGGGGGDEGGGAEGGEESGRPGVGELDVGGGEGESGAGEGEEGNAVEEVQGAVPGVELEEGVGAHDEDESGGGIASLEEVDGAEGVGGGREGEFDRAELEGGCVGDGEAQHGESVGVGDAVGQGFVGGDGAGEEPDGGAGGEAEGVARDGEVSEVYGVEGAAEEADGTGAGVGGEGEGVV